MSASDAASGDRPDAPNERTEEQAPQTPTEPDQSALKDVLDATFSAVSQGQPLPPEEMGALEAVAKKYQGESLRCDPVVWSLVESILEVRYRALRENKNLLIKMSSDIAEALFDSPTSKSHLEDLWRFLQESVR